ncbi:TRAP transporter small permease [Paracoccus salsus]|uniref:TRAP transporter small permease n=1 Tax=Paracoccus salsus TaxID=2911061 RepID=UPI001F38F8BC|nr:TRAP transporter small permease subunit [Paracoccus salsus]MCF3973407.1 TRAP transporter small permease subunit [Paracoccus salsus]
MRVIERTLLDLGMLALILLCAVIFGNVVLRGLSGSGIPDAIILVRELMVAAIVLPLAAATAARAHVAVTFLSDRMPVSVRARLILMGHGIALLALLPLIHASLRVLMQVWESGAFYHGDLNLPRWPGITLFLAGMVIMWMRIAMMLVADASEYRATGTISDEQGQEAV